MGVYGLTGLLKRYAPNSVKSVSASLFSRQSIAIDASCHLNKFVYGEEPVPHRHIYGFYTLATFCQLNNIIPIFVFDGPKRLEAKQLEHVKRAKTRHKVKHSLVFEKEQALRLEAWTEITEALICQQELFPEENTFDILKDELPPLSVDNKIEAKMMSVAQDSRMALELAQNKEKYTRTVRNMAVREHNLASDMIVNRLNDVKSSLENLKIDNQQMLNSLEKRSTRITQQLRDECQEFLKTLGYVCFTCDNHEAEAMCANLAKQKRTIATVSEDMDTLAFGDTPILRYFFSKGRPILSIDPVIARNELNLTRDSFIDLCILCGTDFSGTIQGIGPHRALQWIKKYGSIEQVLNHLEGTPYSPQPTFNYKLARLVFDDLPPIPSHDMDYEAPVTNQATIDDMLAYYEIDPIDAEIKLRTTLLSQNIIDSQSWTSNPFVNNTTNNTTTDNNSIDNNSLFQFT